MNKWAFQRNWEYHLGLWEWESRSGHNGWYRQATLRWQHLSWEKWGNSDHIFMDSYWECRLRERDTPRRGKRWGFYLSWGTMISLFGKGVWEQLIGRESKRWNVKKNKKTTSALEKYFHGAFNLSKNGLPKSQEFKDSFSTYILRYHRWGPKPLQTYLGKKSYFLKVNIR